MAFLFSDLKNEVKRRGTKDQGGSQFTTGIENIINTSIFRLARECPWRPLRRKGYFATVGEYTTGTVTATADSTTLTGSGTSWLANASPIGRRITISGSTKNYIIRTIVSDTSLTLDQAYDGTTASSLSYTISGQESYNLPIQAGHRMFMWHEYWGSPYLMNFISDQEFIGAGPQINTRGVPTVYRMWGEDMVREQPKAASVMRIYSSSSSDTSKNITIFGTVGGYPDYEIISTNGSDGTTAVSGSKSFTSIDRVVKDASTIGRITVDCNSANTVVAVLPVGDTTAGIMYRKIDIWPLPQAAFDMNLWYYKDPYRLVNDADVHELGGDFDESIILLAVSKIKYESNQKEGDKFFALYKDELVSLKRAYMDKIDWLPRMERPRDARRPAGNFNKYLSYSQIGSSGSYGPRVW